MLHAQLNLHPTTKKETNRLKNRVLNNTDHFYFGVETGVLFDFSKTIANDPAYNGWEDNQFRGTIWQDIAPLANRRIYIGYKWKSNFFELGYCGYHGYARVFDKLDSNQPLVSCSHFFGALQFGYYYRIPFKSDFWNFKVGPELGWAFVEFGLPAYDYQEHGDPPPTLDNYAYPYANMVLGFSLINEFRISRKVNIVSRVNIAYIYGEYIGAYYRHLNLGGPTTFTTTYFEFFPLNLNFTFGLKFDFFSQKKKQQTFDKLGIEDPYKK